MADFSHSMSFMLAAAFKMHFYFRSGLDNIFKNTEKAFGVHFFGVCYGKYETFQPFQ